MELPITKEWFERRAKAEADLEIGAGFSVVNPTDADIAQMEVLAERALPQWAQDELARLRAALAAEQVSEVDPIDKWIEAWKAAAPIRTLDWKSVLDPWPMEGMKDVEAVTEIGTYTISMDQPALGGVHYLWLAGNDSDEHDSEHRNMVEARAAAQADYTARIRASVAPTQEPK